MKKMLMALGALLTVSALPIAHADGYWNNDDWNGDGRASYDTVHIHHDRGEMQQAYWKRSQDIREYWLARNSGDWDAMQRERMEIGQDNARIAHEQREIHHYGWDRWQSHDHDWD